MEQYIVAALTASLPKNEQCLVVKENDVIIATHSKVYGPASKEECEKWVKENCGIAIPPNPPDGDDKGGNGQLPNESQSPRDPRWFYVSLMQYGLIVLVTIVFVFVIYKGMSDIATLKNKDTARGLITFLVAVATIAIAVLATLTAMIVRDFKERFAMTKEVLALMIGVLGTIIGFYFGQATNENKDGQTDNSNTEANKSVNTNTNTNANTSINTNTNANANKANGQAFIFRAPIEKGRYVSVVYESGKRKNSVQ